MTENGGKKFGSASNVLKQSLCKKLVFVGKQAHKQAILNGGLQTGSVGKDAAIILHPFGMLPKEPH